MRLYVLLYLCVFIRGCVCENMCVNEREKGSEFVCIVVLVCLYTCVCVCKSMCVSEREREIMNTSWL